MKRQFQDIDVECWRHTGKLGHATPAICLFHSETDRGQPILDALDELPAEARESKRTLTLKSSGRKRSISTLRFRLVSPRCELRVMNIASDGPVLTIEMTDVGLQLVRKAMSAWLKGAEDFGVSPDQASLKKREFGSLDKTSGELWFWGPTMEP